MVIPVYEAHNRSLKNTHRVQQLVDHKGPSPLWPRYILLGQETNIIIKRPREVDKVGC